MRRAILMACAMAVAAVLPSAATAESLVYRDAGGDISAARADGTGVARVTTDASPAGVSYSPPAVDDAGGIVMARRVPGVGTTVLVRDREGTLLRGPYVFDMPICTSISPFRIAVQPSGVFAAATYIHGTLTCTGSSSLRTRMVSTRGPTTGDVYGSYADLTEPRFLRRPEELLAGVRDDVITVWKSEDEPVLQDWMTIDGAGLWDIDSFDVHPANDLLLMEQSPEGAPDGGERRDIALVSYTGRPGPASVVSTVCTRDGLVGQSTLRARPRYSPDGSRIAWNGPAGIYVSPAPAAGAGGICTLSPSLVIPGGRDVEWARFDIPLSPTPGPGDGGPGGGAPGGGAPGGGDPAGPGGPAAPVPTRLAMGAVSKRTAAAFRSGLRVPVVVPAAGTVRVVATVPAAVARRSGIAPRARSAVVVASATRRVAAPGRVTVVLRPTARAKAHAARLRGARLTVRVTVGRAKVAKVVALTR